VGTYALAAISARTVTADNPSSLNSQAYGIRALYRFYGIYFHVERSAKDWNSVSSQSSAIVVTSPFRRSPSAGEAAHLEKWIDHGGTLIYCPTDRNKASDQLPAPANNVSLQNAVAADTIPISNNQSPILKNVHILHWQTTKRIVTYGNRFLPLVADKYGMLAAVANVGKGRVIILADSNLVSNKDIALGDNAVFAYNLVSTSAHGGVPHILFDEYHHGVGFSTGDQAGQESFPVFLWRTAPTSMKDAFAIALAILVVTTLSANCILGPREPLYQAESMNALNIVHGVSRLMKRAAADGTAIEILTADLRTAVRTRFDIAPDVDVPEIVAAVQRQNSVIGQELGTLFVQLTSASSVSSPRETVMLLARLEHMRRMITVD
jgi:hypothetical protein